MKRLILTGSFIAAASLVSFGQGVAPAGQSKPVASHSNAVRQAPTPESAAEKRAVIYKKQLGLNEDQYKRIYEIELHYAKEDQMARANGGMGQGQAMQMQMAKDQQIKSVLNAEQNTKYDATKPKTAAPAGK